MFVKRTSIVNLNISFLAEKLEYSHICGTKVGTTYKNGV